MKQTIEMTREEQISRAAREYHGIILSSLSNILHFEAGAHWADKHPDLSSLWHDTSEEPKYGEIILVEVINTRSKEDDVNYYVEYSKEWVINSMKTDGFICRWAYIKDLLPKGGEQ